MSKHYPQFFIHEANLDSLFSPPPDSAFSLTSSELCLPPLHTSCSLLPAETELCVRMSSSNLTTISSSLSRTRANPEFKTREMEVRSELKQNIYEIFKDFMTGITKLEELDNATNIFLLRFQQGLCLLKRSPILTSSKLIENILKNNETRRLKSYVEAGCINIDDAARSTRALHTSLSGLSDHLIKAQSLLSDLERLTDDAALAIETATKLSTQLDEESSDDLRQVTSEENETVHFAQEPEVTEYATIIAVVYSMVKQNYVMQEKIVRSLSLKTSFDELDTYTLMWSLRPFVEDEIMNRAWKCIY
ncbi:uncharacterized protein LOC103873476 isoform X1 [Brassica rapa]|uniref:uncharacterized protein LOC103873476 isoform X1 n=2 Tax=Brassica campestris TaxID=3711 RepID=UPI00142D56A3|nr:uncharacterized protein LOC103873476 isoform X1 [Brassica rapa]XP_033128090.1 uncharacterized protein LOC103873476 isoform X1 [Brassica rapa]XP_033128091.1 uncharacterized protein LOC103873476 isoform X1 [Brassica rapa]XP_033128092.1 uncharacterized protein LOC103873476 isoform X1 [Brassica rapa]